MKYLSAVLLILIIQACNTSTSEKSTTNDLPAITLQMTDGTFLPLKKIQGKTLLVLFQPECDHCQQEAASMSKHSESFKNYQVYYISASSMIENQQFALEYGLSGLANFHFGSTSSDLILENFGSIPTPSIYVYSEEGDLKNEFIGQTPIDQIISAL